MQKERKTVKQNKIIITLAIEQSLGPLFSSSSRTIYNILSMSYELLCRY